MHFRPAFHTPTADVAREAKEACGRQYLLLHNLEALAACDRLGIFYKLPGLSSQDSITPRATSELVLTVGPHKRVPFQFQEPSRAFPPAGG